jgi:hypothetical protein
VAKEETINVQLCDARRNPRVRLNPKILLDRNTLKIQQEITDDFEVAISIRNRDFPQIPSNPRPCTECSKPWWNPERRKCTARKRVPFDNRKLRIKFECDG